MQRIIERDGCLPLQAYACLGVIVARLGAITGNILVANPGDKAFDGAWKCR